MEESKKLGESVIPFIKYLLSKKALLILNFVFISVVSLIYVMYFVPVYYKTNVTFLPSMKFTPSSNPLQGLGISLANNSGIEPYQVEEIFNTRKFKRIIIDEFDLIRAYKLEKHPNKYVKAEQMLSENMSLSLSELGAFTVTKIMSYNINTYATNPDTTFQMAEFAFNLLDSFVTEIEQRPVRLEYEFLEKTIAEKEQEFSKMKDEYTRFSVDNKAYSLPEQLELVVKQVGELKTKVMMNNIKIAQIEKAERNSYEVKRLINENRLITREISELEVGTRKGIFPSLKESPELLQEELDLKASLKMYHGILIYLKQQLEEVSVKLSKSTSGLEVIDPPVVPEYKSRPKRAVLILLYVFIYMGGIIILLFLKKVIPVFLNKLREE